MPASALYTIHGWSSVLYTIHCILLYTWLVCPDLQSLGKPTEQHMFFSSSDNFFSHAIKGKRICLIHFYMVLIGLTMITRGKKSCTGKRSHQLCGFGLIILKRNFFIASAKLVKKASWLTIPARTYIYVSYFVAINPECMIIQWTKDLIEFENSTRI